MVLLAHRVKLLHQLCFAGNAKLLAARQQQLLVNQVAKQIALLVEKLLFGPLVLPRLLVQVLQRAIVIRGIDDLIVDPGDNRLHRSPRIRGLRRLRILAGLREDAAGGKQAEAGGQNGGKDSNTGRSKSKGHVCKRLKSAPVGLGPGGLGSARKVGPGCAGFILTIRSIECQRDRHSPALAHPIRYTDSISAPGSVCSCAIGNQRIFPRMSSRARRTLVSLVVFFCICGLAGMFISQKVGAQSSTDESAFRDSLKQFTNVYQIVAQNYAEPLTGDKPDDAIYDGAIPGMLRMLDPHSNFYDPKAYAKMREDQQRQVLRRGHGHPAAEQQDRTSSIPSRGTPVLPRRPAARRRHPAVDGKPTDGMDIYRRAPTCSKGQRERRSRSPSSREGSPSRSRSTWSATRFPHPSIDLKYEIKPGVGYIHITQFQETTGQRSSRRAQQFPNIKGLVLDLRGNPGGLLSRGGCGLRQAAARRARSSSPSADAPILSRTTRATHGNRRQELPHRRAGQSHHRVRRGDRLRRFAGPRPCPHRRRRRPSARGWCRPSIRSPRTPGWR